MLRFPPFPLLAVACAVTVLSGCSFDSADRLSKRAIGIVLVDGFEDAGDAWTLGSTRFWEARATGKGLAVTNTPLGTGVSPIWFSGEIPSDFEIRVRARIRKEGLDGGWGIEFGARDRKFAYRALVYASGRFCLDRLFDLYPEFIHCIPRQPEVEAGTSTNVLTVRVVGQRVEVRVNDQDVVVFDDERYEAGELSLAVAGAGTSVSFEDIAIVSLE
ncbi:MAG: hypothetical protein FJ109_02140 [Deltaproteobacteria bacterium]|nr:hypothetical protein [Deltaproteobacteria bacterium]